MKSNKKYLSIAFLLMVAVSLSSCGLFRKKNRCNTCPKWDDMPAAHSEELPADCME